ncbi:hypothetical protein CEXT_534431 [Caerostris extrusa]|uniref:Uncharacterized protein n=1 Tax=Caerostris extrusa TaxID=172846 RepID=A0AAV4XFP6_CAEEX|nr:hypothetical protein CEXT_534431 [Caerostris extrusa]
MGSCDEWIISGRKNFEYTGFETNVTLGTAWGYNHKKRTTSDYMVLTSRPKSKMADRNKDKDEDQRKWIQDYGDETYRAGHMQKKKYPQNGKKKGESHWRERERERASERERESGID